MRLYALLSFVCACNGFLHDHSAPRRSLSATADSWRQACEQGVVSYYDFGVRLGQTDDSAVVVDDVERTGQPVDDSTAVYVGTAFPKSRVPSSRRLSVI